MHNLEVAALTLNSGFVCLQNPCSCPPYYVPFLCRGTSFQQERKEAAPAAPIQ